MASQYEYRSIKVTVTGDDRTVSGPINAIAAEGWRVIGFTAFGDDEICVLFEREEKAKN